MTFQQALGEAITKDVLFMHIDCGAFLPYRWNPATMKVEWWSVANDKWNEMTHKPGESDDWLVTELPQRRSGYRL